MNTKDEATKRLEDLFEEHIVLYRANHQDSDLNFDRLHLGTRLKLGQWRTTEGRFSDVHKGKLDGNVPVAVKLLRLPAYSERTSALYRTVVKRFVRELNTWRSLNHVNVLSLIGLTLSGGRIGFVSDWQSNRTLVRYLQGNSNSSKLDLILDVAEGIQYLHTCSPPVIHGDLKGANILISEVGIARLADFGLSRSMGDIDRRTGLTTTGGVKGTTLWMAPEVFKGSPVTLPSDIYSCGGVFLEICCPGKRPYDYLSQYEVLKIKEQGEHPKRLNYGEMEKMDSLWQLMTSCWQHNPLLRPGINEIVTDLYKQFRLQSRLSEDIVLRPSKICGFCESEDYLPLLHDDYLNSRAWSPCLSHHSSNQMESGALFQRAILDCRTLAQGDPENFHPELAKSLSNCSIHLRNLDRHGEALQYSQAKLAIHRALAKGDPAKFNLELAKSLSSLCGDLRNLGRFGEALQCCQEALGICRALVQGDPAKFSPELAKSLSNISADLSIRKMDLAL